jgi:putative hydrolase of the HAD superfamily
MRRALISDFGGVLTSPLQEGFLAYQEESGVSLVELGKAMAKAAEQDGDHPLFVLERGEITELEFRERIEAHLESGFDLTRLRTLYFERLKTNRRMIDFIAQVRRRGTRTALLTNNVRKPDPAIYELTLERLGGVEAGDCVFVDDLEVNCETARQLGMSAVRFVDADQAIPQIESALAE